MTAAATSGFSAGPVFTVEESIKKSNSPQLKEAYLNVAQKKETLKKYIDAMKP